MKPAAPHQAEVEKRVAAEIQRVDQASQHGVSDWMRDRIRTRVTEDVLRSYAEPLERESPALIRRLERGDWAAATALVDLQARRHDIKVIWRAPSAMPKGAAAYAHPEERSVHVPLIAGVEQLATVHHELGHVLAGPCTRTAPHHQLVEGGFSHCAFCETLAWRHALEDFAPEPFLTAYHAHAARALELNRKRCRMTTDALGLLDAFVDPKILTTVRAVRAAGGRRAYFAAKVEQWRKELKHA